MKLKAALLVLSVLAIGPLALTFAGAQEDDSAEKGAITDEKYRFMRKYIVTAHSRGRLLCSKYAEMASATARRGNRAHCIAQQ